MAPSLTNGLRGGGVGRSSSGCWTCRLRRKKCDEKYPVCATCAQLLITCHYERCKPEWMDGGPRQEEMAERLKREVKEKAHHRRVMGLDGGIDSTDLATNGLYSIPHNNHDSLDSSPDANGAHLERVADCALSTRLHREKVAFGKASETVLLMFFLEQVVPFMFSLYRPTPFEGGKAWLMEMMISSPVLRQAALCQSSFFFSLMRETDNDKQVWETVLTQTAEAFETLRKALQYIDGTNIAEHMHGTVRVLASVLQVQRFEIAVLSFDNCRAHLSAALALFEQLMQSCGPDTKEPKLRFQSVLSRLGPTARLLPGHSVEVQSAEQAAFRFSTALLFLDDIIASTVLQEPPRLYEYHGALLAATEERSAVIDLENVIGCQNSMLLQVGETSALDSWKQQRKRDGTLDVMELVRRATFIEDSVKAQLHSLATRPLPSPGRRNTLLDQTCGLTSANQRIFVTRVWGHAALLYLSMVVSGWQLASVEVHRHVESILNLLDLETYPPALLRQIAWPFCVAGCLAMPAQEGRFRAHVEALESPGVFGTICKAFKIMENVWRSRGMGDVANRDIATFFRYEGDLVLLV